MEAGPLSGLTQHAASSKAKSLSTGTIRVGPRAACPMGSARIYESRSFPQQSAGLCVGNTGRLNSTVVSASGKTEEYLEAAGSEKAQDNDGKLVKLQPSKSCRSFL